MSESVTGVITSSFEHHVVITLPDGRAIQVPHDAIEEHIGELILLRADAKIEQVFNKRNRAPEQQVLVPADVLARIPA